MNIIKKVIGAIIVTTILILILIGVLGGSVSFDILWGEVSPDAKLIFIGLVIIGILS